jgi:ABC-type multidrug transport system fused ATPase/permease subunit
MFHEFMGGLEAGYETILGGGGGLASSGGLKQTLTINRARLRNPSILILGTFAGLQIIFTD